MLYLGAKQEKLKVASLFINYADSLHKQRFSWVTGEDGGKVRYDEMFRVFLRIQCHHRKRINQVKK